MLSSTDDSQVTLRSIMRVAYYIAAAGGGITIGIVEGVTIGDGLLTVCGLFVLMSIGMGGLRVPRHVWIVLGLLSLGIWASWVAGGFEGAGELVNFIGALVLVLGVVHCIRKVREIEYWFLALGFGLLAVTLVSYAGYFEVIPNSVFSPVENTRFGPRMTGIADNPNAFASILIVGAIALGYVFVSAYGMRRWMALGGFLTLIPAMVFTQSRSGIIGMVIIVSALWWNGLSGVGKRSIYEWPVFKWLGLALLAFLGWGALEHNQSSIISASTVFDKYERIQLREEDWDVRSARVHIYGAALDVLKSRPAGVGLGPNLSQEIGALTGVSISPHNFVLTGLVRYGLIGGGLYVGLWFLVPFGLLMNSGSTGWKYILRLRRFLGWSMFGYMVHGMFHSVMNWTLLWLVWGTGYVLWMTVEGAGSLNLRRGFRET